MPEPITTEQTCPATFPGTDQRCDLPVGHEGAHGFTLARFRFGPKPEPITTEQKWIDAAFAALDADSIETTDDDAYLRTVLRILWPVVEALVTQARWDADEAQRRIDRIQAVRDLPRIDPPSAAGGSVLLEEAAKAYNKALDDVLRALDGDDERTRDG